MDCFDGHPPPAKSQPLKLMLFHLLCGAICAAGAQNLHTKLTGRFYADDKISVTAPTTWSIAIDEADGMHRGAILRQGKYILRLCTSCTQVSGIVGGRFSEISGLVQPWYRVDPAANQAPCGQQRSTRISEQLNRIDFWFRRDPAHTYDEEADDCRQPKTTATVWYGSYFEENCSFAATGQDCGGYFLHLLWLTGQHARAQAPTDEMAFALTYDETDLDQLPHKGDPALNRVLVEATNIVRSVHFTGSKMRPAGTASP
jgi:hypothetical protein